MTGIVVTAFICGVMFGWLSSFIALVVWTKVNTDELESPWPNDPQPRTEN
jgi:hypothetical protein